MMTKKQWLLLCRLQRMGLIDKPFVFQDHFPQTTITNRRALQTFNELRDQHLILYTGEGDFWRVPLEALESPHP